MAIGAIRVGQRHRKDPGDIEALAASIADVGLMHPIVVRPDGTLIAGERRLQAAKLLGCSEIAVTVLDLVAVVRGEYAENAFRKDFTPSEMVAIADDIEPLEHAQAKQRQGERTDKHPENFSGSSNGRALDKVARVAGTSRPTLAKARAVVNAAAAEPERFGKLVEDMDATGHVDRAFKQLQIARQQQEHAARIEDGCTVDDLAALAASGKRFPVIYADPPWPWGTFGPVGRIRTCADHHYRLATLDEIKALPVAALAADDCALLIWGTWPRLPDVLQVIAAWGFTYESDAFVWVKTTPQAEHIGLDGAGLFWGMGYHTRSNSEFVLRAIKKGSPSRLAKDVHQVVLAPVGEHSAKPEEVRRRIERLYPGPYLELFGRSKKEVPGWTVWGDEIQRDQFPQEATDV
jgi:N6-adenosine-specific RNA methylase IME4/ParB-like chromosome segregation protein Spo0J